MKTQFSILLFILVSFCSLATAQNMVPNYSFEDHSACPYTFNQADFATGWYKAMEHTNPAYHSEYCHACGTSSFSSPKNTWGHQAPSQGDGYIVLCTHAPTAPEHRENIYAMLIAPMSAGSTYTVSLKASKVDTTKRATDKLGLKFSTTTSFPVNNTAHIYSSSVIDDATGWVTVTGSFVADSAYRYVCVGNFFEDGFTTITTPCSSCPFTQAGYYIDEICVTAGEGSDCTQPLEQSVKLENDFLATAGPNPIHDKSTLCLTLPEAGEVELTWWDVQGRALRHGISPLGKGRQKLELDRGNLAPGIYLLEISYSGKRKVIRVAVE